MNALFQGCKKIKYLDLSQFNTSKVIDMGFFFNKCYELKEIKGLTNLNTSNVSKMIGFFQDCIELEELDLSSFNTSKVLRMCQLFR